VEPPPLFFDPSVWIFDTPDEFFPMSHYYVKEAKFKMVNNSCFQDFEFHNLVNFEISFYGQCKQDKMTGIFSGTLNETLNSTPKNTIDASWQTKFVFCHSGQQN